MSDSDSTRSDSATTDGEGDLGDDEVFQPTAGMLALEKRRRQPKSKVSQGSQTPSATLPLRTHTPESSPEARSEALPVRGLEYDISPRLVQSTISPSPTEVNGTIELLERLVKTHPIWYLPHLSRTAASHLLKRKESGAFIVRESSRPGTMAVSIRLSTEDPSGLELDHYLIETTKGNSIRLEGSPHFFPVLPVLLAHYCLHGEELRTKLRLPKVLMESQSRRELHSYALLGQEFWSTEEASGMAESQASLQLSFNGPSPEAVPSDDEAPSTSCTCPSPQPPRDWMVKSETMPESCSSLISVKPRSESLSGPISPQSSTSAGSGRGRLKHWLLGEKDATPSGLTFANGSALREEMSESVTSQRSAASLSSLPRRTEIRTEEIWRIHQKEEFGKCSPEYAIAD